MRVWIAGGTGVIGRPLVKALMELGHEVTAMVRDPDAAKRVLPEAVARVRIDLNAPETVAEAMAQGRPEAVIHQLTAIPPHLDARKVAKQMAPTNWLRSVGTRVLVDAAKAAGVRRFIAQSIAFVHRPGPPGLRTEEDPLYLDAPAPFQAMVKAVDDLERTTLEMPEGMVLRYGYFTGAHSIFVPGGNMYESVRKGMVPLVGDGNGVFSFIHIDDAVAGTLAALEKGIPGIYQIVEDEPAAARDWLPVFARHCGGWQPWKVPVWMGRLGGGPYGVFLMCEMQGATNTKAAEVLGWRPQRSWREYWKS